MNSATAQRAYHDSSVLASGAWYKIAVKEAGVYKVDLPLLRTLGITAISFPSSSIRLYGNGGGMLPENCAGSVVDDLQENAIQLNDGGDGVFNGSDYFLFFAAGPHHWILDTASQTFSHRKNLYSDQSFYFITLGGTGKRMGEAGVSGAFNQTIASFSEHYFYEPDSINLLNSGKDWYGEDFSTNSRNASRSFVLPLQNMLGGNCSFTSSCISRSIGTPGSFNVGINNIPVLQHLIPAVGQGILDPFAQASTVNAPVLLTAPGAVTVSYAYQSGAYDAQGWLDWFEFSGRRSLSMQGSDQLLFRDLASVGAGNRGKFILQNAGTTTQVWDITDPLTPYRLPVTPTGGAAAFINDCSTLHEYIAFNSEKLLAPQPVGRIENQNLHRPAPADLIIITHPAVQEQAARLAAYHTGADHLNVLVVPVAAIYNEFASGGADPTALRDFVKMIYDRAGADSSKRPRYLLLFGDASYDYKNRLKNNSSLVPAFESRASTDPLATYTSDDFFGFLDDREDISNDTLANQLDIGIGRVPAATAAQAKAYVDKVISYTSAGSRGAWRNRLSFVADDEDFNLHFHDAEIISATADTINPGYTGTKIYLDAYQQESTPSGSRYPLVNQDINNGINQGTLIWNYSGHGSARRLAEEVVLDESIVDSWRNEGKLPLFITATCDFAPYDNPANYSLGENILLREKTGAIALMTTTRLVFAYSNRIINQQYMQVALQKKRDGTYYSLGEAVMLTKNNNYRLYNDPVNNRKFTLLGDPALTLAFPRYTVQTTAINGKPIAGVLDTLKALQQYEIRGQVAGASGAVISNFNGTVNITVYDKAQTVGTLGNDPESMREDFKVENAVLFKGSAKVKNGEFAYSFVVPQDISYLFGRGRISYYAQSGDWDGNGSYRDFIIGGSQRTSTDVTGPEIKAYLNNESFQDGGTTGENPLLIVHLKDSSGINIIGTGIGHDLVAVLDSGKQVYRLNPFFESDPNSFQQGTVRYQLSSVSEGEHTLQIKAWDGVNNSNGVAVRFRVVKQKGFSILNVSNYPNPVLSSTVFHFEHDAAVSQMQVSINIFTAEGKLIKALKKTIKTEGSRFCEVEWEGRDNEGAKPHKGIYFYQITAVTDVNTRASKSGRCLIW
ncbi:MAG: type IX secretion system sortase PorU [Williamsia sp.]|nr:type IX secretion system sortase PorU [Williamsia sp.]